MKRLDPIINCLRKMATTATMMEKASVTVAPGKFTMMDQKIDIKVTGLKPKKDFTVAACMEENGSKFVSYGHYSSDDVGLIDLQNQKSVGGTFKGCHPMGLFWSLKQAPGQKPGLRLNIKDVTEPMKLTLSVMENHINADTMEIHKQEVVTQTEIFRKCLADDVERIPIREGNLRGCLFVPKGKERYPGVIDLYGTAGGLLEYRAAMLASHGFAVFALAYFGYDDLPTVLMPLPLDYQEEAVDWLSSHPKVSPGGVGMIGISKGTEIVVLSAIRNKKIKAAVLLNGFDFVSTSHTYKDETIDSVELELSALQVTNDGIIFKEMYNMSNKQEHHLLPIENAPHTQFLVINGEDDQMTDYSCGQKLADRLKSHGLNNYECVTYKKAGHLLEPPYFPTCRSSFHKFTGGLCVWGGEDYYHSEAQENMWSKVQGFFGKHLPPISSTSKL